MDIVFAIITGFLVACSTYLLLRRHLLQVFFGLILMSNAVNLLIFTMGRITRGKPPLIPEGADRITETVANPLPQALILTSIVISFGLLAYLLVLVYRAEKTLKTTDVHDLILTEQDDDHSPDEKPPAEGGANEH